MVRRHGSALIEAVQQGLEDERAIPVPQKPSRSRNLRVGPGMDRYLTPLKDWRNAKVKRTGMPPVAVANNTLLKEIARLAPTDLEALSEVPGIRRWQLSAHGEEVLSLVAAVKGGGGGSEAPTASDKPKRRRRRRSKKTPE